MEDKLITLENIRTFLANLFDNDNVSVNSTWNSDKINSRLQGKQDVISDLSSIRSGANLGRTALQEVPSEYVDETEMNTTLNTRLASYATTASVESGLATKADVYEVATVEEIGSLFIPVPTHPASNEIWYTTSDGSIITPTTPASLPTIVSNTYENGKGVIKFENDITSIGDDAFSAYRTTSELETVIMPDCVTSIGTAAFYQCRKLVTVDIPESVVSIGNVAFDSTMSTSLISLTIPDSVTSLGQQAFANCPGIQELTIGKGVTTIGKSAFRNLYYLSTINYTGTMAQWNAVTKGSNWIAQAGTATGVTPPTVVHCSDGDVNL